MAGYNRIILVGNLTRDPDYKQLASGQPVCRLGLASNRQYKNRQTGALVQEVCFVDIDVFGPQAESCNQYLQKGRAVLIEGRLKFDTWESQEGQTRSKHSIIADRVVFLSTAQASSFEGATAEPMQKRQPEPQDPAVKKAAAKVKQVQAKQAEKQVDEQNAQSNTDEFSFKDEPPFQDDLPF